MIAIFTIATILVYFICSNNTVITLLGNECQDWNNPLKSKMFCSKDVFPQNKHRENPLADFKQRFEVDFRNPHTELARQ